MKKILSMILCITIIMCSCRPDTSTTKIIDNSPPVNITQVAFKMENVTNMPKRYYNPKMLQTLERADLLLKSGDVNFYNWNDNTSCNVGLIAQIGLNKTKQELYNSLHDGSLNSYYTYSRISGNSIDPGSWTNMTNYYCGITGKPVANIIGDLQKIGFNSLDISGLEYLSDTYILSKTDIETSNSHYTNVNNLIKYLDAWIDIIKKQQT